MKTKIVEKAPIITGVLLIILASLTLVFPRPAGFVPFLLFFALALTSFAVAFWPSVKRKS
jgi:hypothetical protein